MKKRLVLKPFVLPVVYTVFAFVVITAIVLNMETITEKELPLYINKNIFDLSTPVLKEEDEKMVVPYSSNDVEKTKEFYDSTLENKENAIIMYDNTYIPNTGIIYSSSNEFEVLPILSGEVIEVETKELLGKSVTIRHDNNIISMYHGLKDIYVKKGDKVTLGNTIGVSGTSELFNEKENNLHLVLSVNGELVNPEIYYGKSILEF